MGGHLHGCGKCGEHVFAYHSCNHRSCPQCGKAATAQWVAGQLDRRVDAPYFMVTFTLPQELRGLFHTPAAKAVYDLFFASASTALNHALGHPKSLCSVKNGFSLVLHTWNQRLGFHPHLHGIVPGAGIDARDRVVTVKSDKFLAPRPALQRAFCQNFRHGLAALRREHDLPPVHRNVWQKKWGVDIQPFGDGTCAIQYLGAYVCRTAISDKRILAVTATEVTYRWKDRAQQSRVRTETIEGTEFVRRYMRHVLPKGLRAVRHYGFQHPAAKATRERIARHTAELRGAPPPPVTVPPPPPFVRACPCCGAPMVKLPLSLLPLWKTGLSPPPSDQCA
ncbi:MAG: transposase [Opitutales bacterium]|nr:transposase [Opitutales bacterium]